ncbi:ketopantoate reductase family protein [Solibacillus sp. FSL H8-0538]|uniref:ketopantoate reductase family protein n=1 Tax=Solibacillus sp. FSL H8-0538 TaxID=2921400 RepID=UPI0030F5E117
MLIQIVGAGAVGMLMASFVAEAGLPVQLVVRRAQQAVIINKQGLVRQNIDGDAQQFQFRSTTRINNETGLIIVAVKYGQLSEVIENLHSVNEQIPILFLQNGLAHFEEGLRLPHQHIAYSSVQFGAQKLDDVTVVHRGIGAMKIAVARGEVGVFQFLEQLESRTLPIVFEANAEQMLLEKALLNCFINPLTAILQIKNGQLLQNSEALQLLQSLYNELRSAFPELTNLVSFEDVQQLCARTANNTSSMLADRLLGRRTEVDTIVGAVIKKAHNAGKQLPTLETLYCLVKAFEESGEKM